MGIKWYHENEDTLWYLLKFLTNFVLAFAEFDVYHSNIKCSNITYEYNFNNKMLFKMKGFDACTLNYENIKIFDEDYMPTAAKLFKNNPDYKFSDKESRINVEL